MASSLLENTRLRAQENGFDLVGVVDVARFDPCQPKEGRLVRLLGACGAAVVVGSSGPRRDPASTGLGLVRLMAALQAGGRRVVAAEPGRCQISFARLAEAAGLGTVSPVTGLLLHPEYGPWVRVHAALLVEGMPFGAVEDAAISDHFQPCCKCAQPCLETVDEPTAACHLGPEHKNGARTPMPQLVAARARPSTVRWLQLSAMRWMPRFLRPS